MNVIDYGKLTVHCQTLVDIIIRLSEVQKKMLQNGEVVDSRTPRSIPTINKNYNRILTRVWGYYNGSKITVSVMNE